MVIYEDDETLPVLHRSSPAKKIPDIPRLRLRTGVDIPQFGYGTYLIHPEDTQRCVEMALEHGIRHIDTAQMYGNEKEVGLAIQHSGIDRSKLFITTKLNNNHHRHDDACRSAEKSLKLLGLDYVDLFLIHWPVPTLYDGDYVDTWKTMLEFQDEGITKSAGVSNFTIEQLQKIIRATGRPPVVNQVEAHPFFANNELRGFHREQHIVTETWSPLGRGRYLDDPRLVSIAQRHSKTPAQIILRWELERGDVIFPKASSVHHLEENMGIFDWTLDQRAVKELSDMDKGEEGRQGPHPDSMDYCPQEKE